MTLEEKSYWRKYIAKILYGWDNGKVDGAGNKTGENDIKNAGTDQQVEKAGERKRMKKEGRRKRAEKERERESMKS